MKSQPDASSLHARACWMSDFELEDQPSEEGASARALVERAVAGDPSAFEQIVVQNERRVLTLAWRLLGQMDAAQDAAQEVFLRAFKYLHRLDTKRPVASWLMGITVNVCRDLGRKRQTSINTFSPLGALQAESTPADQAENPHDQLVSHQHQEMLWVALEQECVPILVGN